MAEARSLYILCLADVGDDTSGSSEWLTRGAPLTAEVSWELTSDGISVIWHRIYNRCWPKIRDTETFIGLLLATDEFE